MKKSNAIINSKIKANIDDEWEMFLLGNQNQKSNNEKIKNEKYKENKISNSNLINQTEMESDIEDDLNTEKEINYGNGSSDINSEKEKCPKCTSIYISTKTNISYLNSPIDIKNVFSIFMYLNQDFTHLCVVPIQ